MGDYNNVFKGSNGRNSSTSINAKTSYGRSSTPAGTSRSYGRISARSYGMRSTTPSGLKSDFLSKNFNYSPIRCSIINSKTKKLFKSYETQEKEWRPSTRIFDPGYGYEKSWRSARINVPGSKETCLQKQARCPTPEWRSTIRCHDLVGRRSLTEETFKPSIKCPTPPPDSQEEDWKPCRRIINSQHHIIPTEWTINSNRRHFTPSLSKTAPAPPISHKSPGIPPPSTWNFSPPKITRRSVEYTKQSSRNYFSQHPPLKLFSDDRGNAASPVPCSFTILPQKKSGRKNVPDYNTDHPQFHVCSSELERPDTPSQ